MVSLTNRCGTTAQPDQNADFESKYQGINAIRDSARENKGSLKLPQSGTTLPQSWADAEGEEK
jgi:hypothetical protein